MPPKRTTSGEIEKTVTGFRSKSNHDLQGNGTALYERESSDSFLTHFSTFFWNVMVLSALRRATANMAVVIL